MFKFLKLNKSAISTRTQPVISQGKEGFVELEYFDKHFVKNTRKK